jgi:hypothetical protein
MYFHGPQAVSDGSSPLTLGASSHGDEIGEKADWKILFIISERRSRYNAP